MTTLTPNEIDALQEALWEADLDDESLTLDYSGRGMYGATCIGITHNGDLNLARVALALERAGESALAEVIAEATPSQDSMGLGTITYFRGLNAEGHEREPQY